MSLWNPFSWGKKEEGEEFEEGIREKLHRLHLSIDRNPGKVDKLERLFLRYQTVIQKNLDQIKDRDDINARIQSIKQAIGKAKTEVKEKEKQRLAA